MLLFKRIKLSSSWKGETGNRGAARTLSDLVTRFCRTIDDTTGFERINRRQGQDLRVMGLGKKRVENNDCEMKLSNESAAERRGATRRCKI